MPGNELLARGIIKNLKAAEGKFNARKFPDGESYIRILGNVKNKHTVIVCTLAHPDELFLPLFFLAREIRNQGAKRITLISPYLSYMRQDKAFHPGEAITSGYFAELISSIADQIITIDPHLHRRKSMNEIYTVKTSVLHAAPFIAGYISKHIANPVIIGPDSESKQWIAEVAHLAKAPFVVMKKTRRGDKSVKIKSPELKKYKKYTPVLLDDIISTGHTMIKTIILLKKAGMKAPVCIGIHAVFSETAFKDLKKAGAKILLTCNTILHFTNRIDITQLITSNLEKND